MTISTLLEHSGLQLSSAARKKTVDAPEAVSVAPRLFVTGLPKDKTEEDVECLFKEFGTIEKVVLFRNRDGTSKGTSVVSFQSFTEAEKALEALQGSFFPGLLPLEDDSSPSPLRLNFAQPRKATSLYAGEPAITPKKLFVGRLPKSADEEALTATFSQYGVVVNINVLQPLNGRFGCAFVSFKTWASCEAAIADLHGRKTLKDSSEPMVVKFANASKKEITSQRDFMPHAPALPHYDGYMAGPPYASHPYDPMLFFNASQYGVPLPYPPVGYINAFPQHHAPLPMHPMNPTTSAGDLREGVSSSENLNSLYNADDSSNEEGSDIVANENHSSLSPHTNTRSLISQGAPSPYPVRHADHQQIMHYMASFPAAGGHGHPMRLAAKLGKGVIDPACYSHKLFVGQVPFDLVESDLWSWFAPYGEILELAILRSQGKSKGCAFLTYESEDQAVEAIRVFHGMRCMHGKQLVVKFANSKR